jgi:hypothetical protein
MPYRPRSPGAMMRRPTSFGWRGLAAAAATACSAPVEYPAKTTGTSPSPQLAYALHEDGVAGFRIHPNYCELG